MLVAHVDDGGEIVLDWYRESLDANGMRARLMISTLPLADLRLFTAGIGAPIVIILPGLTSGMLAC